MNECRWQPTVEFYSKNVPVVSPWPGMVIKKGAIMKRLAIIFIIFGLFLSPVDMDAKSKGKKDAMKKPDSSISSATFMGLKFRTIGPAFTSGRIADFAVNPNDPSEYYVAVAAGNVFKTRNSGVTWTPIFDRYGAWSIADVEIDPRQTNVVWVGTGEYNSQRAIGYGDGVYRSEDGGKTFKNMGLKNSEHIGRIIIDPRNSHVYVAAQGPLWGPGGDRGLYKSTDEGKTWKKILDISKDTGITDIVMDPRNPDVLYCASYQRRRRVWTLINGGPEGAIYKSMDAGATWTKMKNGLPRGDVGRIGLAISPVNPDVVYAIIEAAEKDSGFYRTTNRGATWKKMSSHVSGSPQYYNRIFCDPKNVDKVFSVETVTHYTMDGGKTWKALGLSYRHVDDHALWINPKDTRHLLIGGDGGIYESFDHGANWLFKSNLSLTQFYRVSVDDAEPFYNVYGGTQDNASMGGPSRTLSRNGILSADWIVTRGGDGFETQIEPGNPDIVYSQSQYGGLVRYDKKSGEVLSIKPMEGKDEAYRWNWNAPLIISPHSKTRLYFAANILFRSDDRGNNWKKVSGDLTAQIDRNQLKVMGKIQSPEAVAKSMSTSIFGNITALDESPKKEGLLYVGTDDGLIQVSEDGGAKWTRIDSVPGVPKMTYVDFLLADLYDENVVYAAFDGRKNNDLKPYLFKSSDKGKTWKSITGNLPQRGTVYTIAQDHVKKELMFVGTEFGVFFTYNGGAKWIQLKGGIPTTQVRDIAIQKRENDLVLATFGRGFWILDDYTPLREYVGNPQLARKKAHIFAIKDALFFMQKGGGYGRGATLYRAKNPPVGATFTYFYKVPFKSLKQKRKAAEKAAWKKGQDIRYPTWDELRKEDNEPKPFLMFTIKDEAGNVVRRLRQAAMPGLKRITWDCRYSSPMPVSAERSRRRFGGGGGVLAPPGKYTVSIAHIYGEEMKELVGPQPFVVKPLNITTLPAKDRRAVAKFQTKLAELGAAVRGASSFAGNMKKKLSAIKMALFNAPNASPELMKQAMAIEKQLKEIEVIFNGDRTKARRQASTPPGLARRIFSALYAMYSSTSDVPGYLKEQYDVAADIFAPALEKIRKLYEVDMKKLEDAMDAAGAPLTPGRLPKWKK